MRNRILKSEGKKYYCFISYRSPDRKFAKRLKRDLISYSLTHPVYKKSRWKSRSVSPIFIDFEGRDPGLLRKVLYKHLDSSKFLIVICSKNLVKKPYWVDAEIEHFKSAYKSSAKNPKDDIPYNIIPYVIDNTKTPETECYSPALQRINEEFGGEFIGTSVSDYNGSDLSEKSIRRQMCFLVLAAIHGSEVTAEDLRKEYKKARRKRIARFVTTVLAILSTVFLITGWFFGTQKHYKDFFVDYSTVYSEPVGIGKVSKRETEKMSSHYTLITKGLKRFGEGHVTELRHENADGVLVDYADSELKGRPVCATYEYANDKLVSETLYDQNETAYMSIAYSADASVADFAHTDSFSTGHTLISDTTSIGGNIFDGSADIPRSSICRFLLEYDESGYILEKRYASDTYNTAAIDLYGVGGVRYSRDEEGRITAEEYIAYYTEEENASRDATDAESYSFIPNHIGIAKKQYSYENYDLVEVKNTDIHGNLSLSEESWARSRRTFEDHNLVENNYYNVNDENMSGNEIMQYENGRLSGVCTYASDGEPEIKNGVFSVEYTYDEKGRRIGEYYYNTDFERTYSDEGFSGIVYTYDNKNRCIAETYLDTEDTASEYAFGYAEIRREYNAFNQITKMEYYDAQGRLKENDEGYAIAEINYDSLGRKESVWFYSAEKKPALASRGYHAWTAEYDKKGNLTKAVFLDTDKKPIETAEECAGYIVTYDESAREIKRTFINGEGDPEENSHMVCGYTIAYNNMGLIERKMYIGAKDKYAYYDFDYAGIQYGYDSWGRTVEWTYLDFNENPICAPGERYSKTVQTYDDAGEIEAWAFYDTQGQLTLCNDGYAIKKAERTFFREICKETYFGIDGQPVRNVYGYAALEISYDEKNRIQGYSYYDVDGALTTNQDGVAETWSEFDQNGNEIWTAYYGTDSHLTVHQTLGFAVKDSAYDELGRVVSEKYYDENAQRCPDLNGVSGKRIEYQEKKEIHTLVDENDQIAENLDGFAGWIAEYDDFNNEIKLSFFDKSKKITRCTAGYAGYWLEYDSYGNCVKVIYFDEKENITNIRSGYAICEWHYSGKELLYISYHDPDGNLTNCSAGYAGICYYQGNSCQFGADGAAALLTMRKNDADVFSESIHAESAGTVSWRLLYRNCSGSDKKDVAIKLTIPDGLEYVAGSLRLFNRTYPNGASFKDDAPNSFTLRIGDYLSGGNAFVDFKTEIKDAAAFVNGFAVVYADVYTDGDYSHYVGSDSGTVYFE